MGVTTSDKGLFTRTICMSVPIKVSSKFIIVPMVTDHLTDRMGLEPILSINVDLMETDTGTETVRVQMRLKAHSHQVAPSP